MSKLKNNYTAANCCHPAEGDDITGYYSHDNIVKVHQADCANLKKADHARLVKLSWAEIMGDEEFEPDTDYRELSDLDFSILAHHKEFGFDYSAMVAVMIKRDRKSVFERHKYLKESGLLERVAPKMIQYRKKIVKNKWIKHRNHTYYDITDKGRKYLKYHMNQK